MMGLISGEGVVPMTSPVSLVSCEYSMPFPETQTDIRSAIELLLEEGSFKPARSVVLAFGMDEETGGKVVRPIFNPSSLC